MSNFKFGRTSLKRLEGIDPDLLKVVKRALKESKVDFSVIEGLRDTKTQQKYYKDGKSELDGIRKKSMHQCGYAVDLCPYKDGKLLWDLEENALEWLELGRAMLRASRLLNIPIIWGISFNIGKGYDAPHFQLANKTCK